MRWLLLLSCIVFLGATPVHVSHDTPKKVDDEFVNAFQSLQPRNLKVVTTTPSLSEIQDGETMLISTGAYARLIFRRDQDIFGVLVSCITVRR